jgi:cell division protein FtsB
MKISKTALIVLGIGVFIIVFATLFVMYSGQSGEQEQLNATLTKAQGVLPELLAEKEDLESQVAQWESELDKAMVALSQSQGRFPKSVESIEYDEVLFKLAEQSGLMIIEITASEPSKETVKGTDITYDVTICEVIVENAESPPGNAGDFEVYIDETVDKVLEFIHLVVTTPDFGVATIKVVSIDGLEPPEELEEGEEGPEALLELAIYGFPR